MTRPPTSVRRALACVTFAAALVGAGTANAYQYLSPVPGSKLNPVASTIVLRDGRPIDSGSVASGRVVVAGTMSGRHTGRLVLARDQRTLVFTPDRPFAAAERVVVSIGAGLRTADGAPLAPETFEFMTSPAWQGARRRVETIEAELRNSPQPEPERLAMRTAATPAQPATAVDHLPFDYVPINVLYSNAPDTSGVIFISPWPGGLGPGRLEIVDNTGQPLFFRKTESASFDWKRQPNGWLTYQPASRNYYYALDATYAVVDSFAMGNGYFTDVHDLQLLPDGHALLMAYDTQPYPMDTVVVGGRADAVVVGAILQELDEDKNVVFQWRSWDHFLITDADTCLVNMRGGSIDYVHVNGVELDHDGNLLMSSRHLNEITKIERGSGAVMWRMGRLAKRNNFDFIDFVGSNRGWSAQHDVRRLPNGHMTLFDNGNCALPHYSRALEYVVDEENFVVTQVWEYRNSPDTYGPFMGNVQRLPSGGSMICWGGTGPNPKATEVHADGSPALQLGWSSPFMYSYRAFKYPWSTTLFTLDRSLVEFGQRFTSTTEIVNVQNGTDHPVTLTGTYCPDELAKFSCTSTFPIVLPPHGSAPLSINYSPALGEFSTATLYVRCQNDTELVAQPLNLSGYGGNPRVALTGALQDEGNYGASTMWFKLTPSFRPLQDIVVHYQTLDGTATAADHDYFPISGTTTMPAGSDSSVIPVTVFGDKKVEPDETFYVAITVDSATAANSQNTATIANDDGTLGVGDDRPLEFALYPARPTPFRDATTLRFDLPRAGHVALEVYDVRGRRVASLVDGVRMAGRHGATWNAAGESSGMYFARLTANGITRTQRIVLSR